MPEVATDEVVESQEDEAPEAEPTATPDPAALTTLQKRLAGKDQALTASQQRAAALQKERDELARWKAEKEGADLTETERLQRERDAAVQEAADAKAEAARNRLARQFPLASDLLGDDIPLDEVRLAEIEGRLKTAIETAAGEDEEPEPRIDPNRSRKSTAAPRRTVADAKAELGDAFKREFPNYGGDL